MYNNISEILRGKWRSDFNHHTFWSNSFIIQKCKENFSFDFLKDLKDIKMKNFVLKKLSYIPSLSGYGLRCQKNIRNYNPTFSSWSSAGEMLFPWSAEDSEPYFLSNWREPPGHQLCIFYEIWGHRWAACCRTSFCPAHSSSSTVLPSEVQSEDAGKHH